MDLMIIHGAGHMVPQWKRAETFHGISKWLAGEEL
jgi:hypothetical protein